MSPCPCGSERCPDCGYCLDEGCECTETFDAAYANDEPPYMVAAECYDEEAA